MILTEDYQSKHFVQGLVFTVFSGSVLELPL
jgi:hypothetical protein